MRLALVVEYDGTAYHGFQYQTSASTIQEELEKAISHFTAEMVRVAGAGRTDAGVHARAQVVAFDTESENLPCTFVRALNFYLPNDIAVKAAYSTGEDFDPRRMALSRRYRYSILNGPTPSPLARRGSCLVTERLSIPKMRRAARLLEGTHDFARFAGPLEDESASTVRDIYEVKVGKTGETVTIDIEGSSFLPRQVRRMAGALVDVGKGKLSREELKSILDRGGGKAVAHALPPHGLCLVGVTYADFPPKIGEVDGNFH